MQTTGHLVVVGASAGGVSALLQLSQALPAPFGAPICIVQHVGNHPSLLPELLRFRGPNEAVQARHGQRLAPGTLHVAPPDQHMLLDGDTVRLTRGPKENHARPAIDPLFRTAALGWGSRAIGVVLTGQMDDGTAGLKAIKDCGGIAVVQDPATAAEPGMPASALANVEVDHCVPLEEIAPLLVRLVGAQAQQGGAEHALWANVRVLRERELLLRRLASIASATGDTAQAAAGQAEADRLEQQVRALAGLTESP